MRRWKWRIVLAAVNLLLAIGMSAVGMREYAADHQLHPGYFYHGNRYYVPTAQWISYCLNAPAHLVANMFDDFAMRYHLMPSRWFGVWCFYFVHYEFYAAVFLFWWWMGWKVDAKMVSQNCSASWGIAESLVGLCVAVLLLFYGSVYVWRTDTIRSVAGATVVWGGVLMWYFLLRISVILPLPAEGLAR
jgi:hypothetical protein